MEDAFTFNARQFYFDLSQDHDDQNVDSYFDVIAENDSAKINQCRKLYEEVVESDKHEMSGTESDCFFSPITTGNDEGPANSTVFLMGKLRKSLSMHNIPTENSEKEPDISSVSDEMTLESHQQPPRPNSACSLRGRVSKAPSQEHINRLAQPKRFTSHDNLLKSNTMTLAEAINKFQAGTPKRFRSKPSPKLNKVVPLPLGTTKPRTPKLMTTTRTRPVNAISKDEQERIEIEEAKKFKIKANPVSKKVLRGPLKPQIEKKPPTLTEPFHLTEVKKKPEAPEEKRVSTFKAQPLPKSLHNPFKPQGITQPPTKGQSPKSTKRLTKNTPDKNIDKGKEIAKPKPTRTQPKPFSFDGRDQLIMKKKEELINKILEEEKKAREFHARPPPKAILKSRNSSQDLISEAGSSKSLKQSTEELDTIQFKARPATVLHMKPFEPKKDENHVVKIEAFQLSTDRRLEARKHFEQKLKEKEAIAEQQKREREEIMKILEEEEVAKLRKQMEYKAQPIKKYKEIKIQSANKVTEPKSPKFHTDKIRNKENIQQ